MSKKMTSKSRREFLKNVAVVATATTLGAKVSKGADLGMYPVNISANAEVGAIKTSIEKARECSGFKYVSQEVKDAICEMSPSQIKKIRKSVWKKYLKRCETLSENHKKNSGKWMVHFLGTCAGMEPWEGRNHTSFVIQKPSGELLWFDAGEYCSWTAVKMGLDITRCSKMFLSHPHGDHIGGITGFFLSKTKIQWVMNAIGKKSIKYDDMTIFTSVAYPVEGAVKQIWNKDTIPSIKTSLIENGKIYEDADVEIEALANTHMALYKEKPQSYSFKIRLLKENKVIVFSGDIRNSLELAPFFENENCDLLILEAAHSTLDKWLTELKKDYFDKIKDIATMHYGVYYEWFPEVEIALAEKAWGKPIIWTQDRQTLVL